MDSDAEMIDVVALILIVDIDVKMATCAETPIVAAVYAADAAAATVDDIAVVAVAAEDVNIDYSDSTYVIDYSHLPHYSVLQYY